MFFFWFENSFERANCCWNIYMQHLFAGHFEILLLSIIGEGHREGADEASSSSTRRCVGTPGVPKNRGSEPDGLVPSAPLRSPSHHATHLLLKFAPIGLAPPSQTPYVACGCNLAK